MAVPSHVSLSHSLKGEQRKAFYEGHKNIALIMILVVFLFPLFGVYISGLLGAAVGMLFSLVAYFLTPLRHSEAWRIKTLRFSQAFGEHDLIPMENSPQEYPE